MYGIKIEKAMYFRRSAYKSNGICL
jgi:hypothetical protein